MELSSIIPEYLLRQKNLLTVYCYLLRPVRNGTCSTIVGDTVVALKPYEYADEFEAMAMRTALSISEIKEALQKLQELQLITLIKEEPMMLVKLNYISLPQYITQESQKLEYNDCWLHDFIKEDQEWIKTNLSPKSLENNERVMKLFEMHVGVKKLSQLRPDDLESYKVMRKTQEPKVSNNTISIDVRTIKAAFERAVRRGRLEANPFRHVQSIRCPKKKMPFFTLDQIAALLHKINEPWLKSIVSFAISTCMRRGEIINLLWKDVHFDDGYILVQSSEEYQVKQGGLRKVPISTETLKILQEQDRNSQWVFSDAAGKSYSADHVSKKFKEYIRLCELPEELHFHSLRATGATWMISQGAPIYSVKEILGHASVKTTEPYASTEQRALREAVEKIALPAETDGQEFEAIEEAKKLIKDPLLPSPIPSTTVKEVQKSIA